MQYPVCQTEMERGSLTVNGTIWSKSWWAQNNLYWGPGNRIFAFRCPKCGKIELTSEVKHD